MKTIKERAERKALAYNNSDVNKQDYYLGYADGAIEQKQIVIDKACEWLEEHLNDDFTKRVSIEEFRKAME